MESNFQENRSVLVVDDNEIILVAIKETLAAEGIEVVSTRSADEAVGLLNTRSFAVVISDNRMHEMDGLEFLAKAKIVQPDAIRILMTGVMQLNTVIDAINKGEIYRFISKPWMREEFLTTIRNAVSRFNLAYENKCLQRQADRLNKQLLTQNSDLVEKITVLEAQRAELNKTHEALNLNFDRCIDLCYRIVASFEPLLGQQTLATVEICERLAQTGHLSPQQSRVLITSAWLHDIGLVKVSRDLILGFHKNPEELSPSELELIHEHPKLAQELVNFADELGEVGPVIRAHHEHWDGTGFPDGIAMENIPEMARYLAVVVYYVESTQAGQDAISTLIEKSGTWFYPDAVRLFLKVAKEVKLPEHVEELTFKELKPGMTLSQSLHTPRGLLLFPKGKVINEHDLQKIEEYNLLDPLTDRILVRN